MSKFTLASAGTNRTASTTLSVTTSSASYNLSDLGIIADTIRIANTGNVGLHYAIDDATVTATTNDIYLPPNSVEYVNTATGLVGKRHIGYICASGSTGLNITVGEEG